MESPKKHHRPLVQCWCAHCNGNYVTRGTKWYHANASKSKKAGEIVEEIKEDELDNDGSAHLDPDLLELEDTEEAFELQRIRLSALEAEQCVFELVVNLLEKKLQHNESQASVEAELKIIKKCLGQFLPTELTERLPGTFKQALAMTR
jgi:hypothetical protein